MYEEFVQKFSSNPAAVAYGNWQISQAYQATGDLPKALDYGDKALAGSPHNLDILVSQASMAQQAKNNAKLMDYAARRAARFAMSIAKQPKPEGMSDEDFARKVNEDKIGGAEQLRFSGDLRIQCDHQRKRSEEPHGGDRKIYRGVSRLEVSGPGVELCHVHAWGRAS